MIVVIAKPLYDYYLQMVVICTAQMEVVTCVNNTNYNNYEYNNKILYDDDPWSNRCTSQSILHQLRQSHPTSLVSEFAHRTQVDIIISGICQFENILQAKRNSFTLTAISKSQSYSFQRLFHASLVI